MAAPRSPFFDSALHVLKGAVVSVLQLPTGRTTASVKQVAAHSGRLVLNSVETFSEEQSRSISRLVEQKVQEDVPFRVWRMPRLEADRLYGDTMYDAFQVPESVTELRLVNLERWNLNANIHEVLRSTGLLKRLEITKTKHHAKKRELEISFECFPDTDAGGEGPALAPTLVLERFPSAAEVVPDPSSPAPPAAPAASAPSAQAGYPPQDGQKAKGEAKAPEEGKAANAKKPRPAAPPPPPALATASLLVRAAAARVLGMRPADSGGELQPLWVTEPGNAKVSLSLAASTLSPFPKEEEHDALLRTIEDEANALVEAGLSLSLFEVERAAAEADYGATMYSNAQSAQTQKSEGPLHLAFVPGVILVEVPGNWSLCGTTAACGRLSFQMATDPASRKKPETLILPKKKQMTIRYSVEQAEAEAAAAPAGAAAAAASGGKRPSPAEVADLGSAVVRVRVRSQGGGGRGPGPGPAAETTAGEPGLSTPPRFPYPQQGQGAAEPAVVYWTWFASALARHLRSAGLGAADAASLPDPSPSSLQHLCSKAGSGLSEAELGHLQLVPLSLDWLQAVLAGAELPRAPAQGAKKEQEKEQEMVVTAMEVSGKIDYTKLVKDFGSTLISPELLARVERLTVGAGRVPHLHPWLRRSIFYSHRDLDRICDCVEKGKPFYLYTGRGPSSMAMHLGHLIPFMMTKWLQDAFDVPLVIQMTDDEKFLWKGKWDPEQGDDLMKFRRFTSENVKDIIAVGFKKEKTFIFSDLEYVGHMYPNIVRIWKGITYNTARACFGFQGENNIGQSAFCAVQAAPSFPTSFRIPLGNQDNMCCLIPCAIDQDPYFRLTREVAHKLVPETHPLQGKPALLHAKFFPPLQGALGKMSASDTSSAIFLTDSPEEIRSKIHKFAFSGGRATAKEQRERGADLDVDVPFQWLRFFLEDDAELEQVAGDYGSGQGQYWNTGSVKDRLVLELQRIVQEHQARREKITDEEVAEWMSVRRLEF